mgnify:CR=1 FL=1
MQEKESDIQRAIIEYLEWNKWFVLRINSGMISSDYWHKGKGRIVKSLIRLAPPGTPDILACSPGGKFIGIEVKKPGKEPTELQHKTLEKICDLGGIGLWATSLKEVIDDLKSVGLLPEKQ